MSNDGGVFWIKRVTAPMWCLAVGLWLCGLSAQEWTFDLPFGADAVAIDLPSTACDGAAALLATWSTTGDAEDFADRWLEVALVSADGRWFTCAAPPALTPGLSGRQRFTLDGSAWASRDGVLGGDALAGMVGMRVRIHGPGGTGHVRGTLSFQMASGTPKFTLEQDGLGLCRRTTARGQALWSEWRLRLRGDTRGERGHVTFVAEDGGRIPAFLDQPSDSGLVWRARGPARWVFRLRPGEAGRRGRLHWTWGDATWMSAALTIPDAHDAEEALPSATAPAMPMQVTVAWTGPAARWAGAGFSRYDQVEFPEALAPVLRWRRDWTGFRGLELTAHAQARALEVALEQGVTAIDLLPRGFSEEQGAFRFGLAPWHTNSGGACAYIQDLWRADGPSQQWLLHAVDLIARCRAAPGLQTWVLGLDAPANDADQIARLGQVATTIAALAGPTPVLARHPQLVAYPYRATDAPWADFERSDQVWRAPAWPGFAKPTIVDGGSNGVKSMALPLHRVGEVGVGACEQRVDANVVNLDRCEWDVRIEGDPDVAAQIYAWATDRHHRWYQIPVMRLQAAPRWTTVGIDLDASAPWQPVGHDQPWTGDQRRQLRRFGIAVFVHGDTAGTASVRLDRIRRLGWPEQEAPSLSICNERMVAEPTARSTPIAVDFDLSLLVRNPYDPEHADVSAEVQAPDGTVFTYPAYWFEPMELRLVDGEEQVLPAGSGRWQWRFSPPRSGRWRWRLQATVEWRGQTLRTSGDWHETMVPDRWSEMVPVRPDPADPQWWKRDDGRFWYPLGINLRSPGDTRQDKVLAAYAAGKEGAARDADVLHDPLPGWMSSQWDRLGTVAFERWLQRCRANGINWVRVWMCPWWCGLEWHKQWDEFGGLNVYNQHAAARLDRVMALAAREGVYVQLELQNHGMTSEFVDQQWNPDRSGNPGSPYSTRNGGPCESAGDFYRSEKAWDYHQKRLRYTLARWGWCSNLAAWVLSSEMEFTGDWRESGAFQDARGGHAPQTQRWIERSMAYIRTLDPLQRAVTVHFSHPWRAARLWRMPGLGFSNSNAYTGFQDANMGLGGAGAGLDRALEVYAFEHFPAKELKRPTLIGEWGGHWERNTPERLLAELHTGLWMQAALPYGGNTGYWWWLLIDSSETWPEFAGVARFTADWDPRHKSWQVERPQASHAQIRALGMGCVDEMRAYCWHQGLDRSLTQPVIADAGQLRLRAPVAMTTWRWQRWDTWRGIVVGEGEVKADVGGRVVLALGSLDRDAAFILRRVTEATSTPPVSSPSRSPASSE